MHKTMQGGRFGICAKAATRQPPVATRCFPSRLAHVGSSSLQSLDGLAAYNWSIMALGIPILQESDVLIPRLRRTVDARFRMTEHTARALGYDFYDDRAMTNQRGKIVMAGFAETSQKTLSLHEQTKGVCRYEARAKPPNPSIHPTILEETLANFSMKLESRSVLSRPFPANLCTPLTLRFSSISTTSLTLIPASRGWRRAMMFIASALLATRKSTPQARQLQLEA